MLINNAVLSGGLVFIDFLHRFVIDHINCYYFRLMAYSIGENQSCEAKGKIGQSQPLVGQDVVLTVLMND